MEKSKELTPMQELMKLSKESRKVINYLIKNNCCISLRWNCGIPILRVFKDGKEKKYPIITGDIFIELSNLLKQRGEYQQTHFYDLKE